MRIHAVLVLRMPGTMQDRYPHGADLRIVDYDAAWDIAGGHSSRLSIEHASDSVGLVSA